MENFNNDTLDISTLPHFETVAFQKVSRKYLIKSNIQTLILLVIALVGWSTLFYYETSLLALTMAMVGIALFFGFKFWNNFMRQPRYGYALREKDILFCQGFLVRTTTVIPFNRIQHVSISRDVLDKMLDIASVQVFTAGGSGSDINIPGLKPELALRLKEALAKKLSADGN